MKKTAALVLALVLAAPLPAQAAQPEIRTAQTAPVSVFLDGRPLSMDVSPQVKNQRVMIPIRPLALALGTDIKWDRLTWTVTMTRGGVTVTMTPGNSIATVNGQPVIMDAAPYVDHERTYFPARYAAQLFGQTVTWDQQDRRVEIVEDQAAGDSQLLDWALPMGALFTVAEGGDPCRFGSCPRSPQSLDAPVPAHVCRQLLWDKWQISDRESLLNGVQALLDKGDDWDFRAAGDQVRYLSPQALQARTRTLSAADRAMWLQTRALLDKWGGKGISAWDLCRCSSLLQWGYTAGYVSYPEALELLSPAVKKLRKEFSSWDEIYENFLDGYYWCLRQDPGEGGVWDTQLGKSYLYLKNAPDTRTLFNSDMFQGAQAGPAEGEH